MGKKLLSQVAEAADGGVATLSAETDDEAAGSPGAVSGGQVVMLAGGWPARARSGPEIYVPEPLEIDGQLISHNIWVGGHRTSVRLEAVMWQGLHEICEREGLSVHQLISLVAERQHPNASLTATIRAFLVAYFRALHVKNTRGPLLGRSTTPRGRARLG